MAAIRAALDRDPFAPDLHRNMAGFLAESGDKAGAERELAIVRALSPRSHITLRIALPHGALRHN